MSREFTGVEVKEMISPTTGQLVCLNCDCPNWRLTVDPDRGLVVQCAGCTEWFNGLDFMEDFIGLDDSERGGNKL